VGGVGLKRNKPLTGWGSRVRGNKRRELVRSKEIYESWVGDRSRVETSNVDEGSLYDWIGAQI
jgi:hypothetical protein